MNSKFFSTNEASLYLKVARQTLAVWRLKGEGPIFNKVGRKVVYEVAALDTFLDSRRHSSTSEYK